MTNQSTFQPGDVVQLKSGGPRMTVETSDETLTSCTWFDTKGELKRADFPTVIVEKPSVRL